MKTTPRSAEEAAKVSHRALLHAGWHGGRIVDATEKLSKQRGTEMIELTVIVLDANGNERTLRDWLTNTNLGALKLRHAAEAVDAMAKYQAGEIGQADFPGHDVSVKISIQKRRGWPDSNQIEDYAAVTAGHVVNLRAS